MSIPYICPVCSGRGLLPPGFYNVFSAPIAHDAKAENCKSCAGTGVYVHAPREQPANKILEPEGFKCGDTVVEVHPYIPEVDVFT